MPTPSECGESRQRVARDVRDLVEALRRHVKLLRDYRKRAFDEADRDYWGEVAGKLRLLLLPFGRNKPLLLLLLEKYGIDPHEIRIMGSIALPEFLNQSGLAVKNAEGHFLPLTNAELINIWATQHGAAHEDWSLTEPFDLLRSSTSQVDFMRVAAASMALIADAAIEAAERVFEIAGEAKGSA